METISQGWKVSVAVEQHAEEISTAAFKHDSSILPLSCSPTEYMEGKGNSSDEETRYHHGRDQVFGRVDGGDL